MCVNEMCQIACSGRSASGALLEELFLSKMSSGRECLLKEEAPLEPRQETMANLIFG